MVIDQLLIAAMKHLMQRCRLIVQVSAMSCGLLPLCYDAMALGEVPFCDVDGDHQQLSAAIGSSSKVDTLCFD